MKSLPSLSFVALLAMGACAPASYGTGPASGLPPPLPPGAQVPLWDYYCAGPTQTDGLDKLLEAAGQNGWELVTSDGGFYCFKRPQVEAGAPAVPADDS